VDRSPTPAGGTHAPGPTRSASRFTDEERTTDVQPLLALRESDVARADRYFVRAEIGRGATSVVLEAWDAELQRVVALKQFRRTDARFRADIVAEARALASIDHRNVVTVHAVHAESDPPFLVMQRIHGRRLDSLIAERGFGLTESLAVLRQLAAGIDAVHAAHLVHGDIKPSNVLIEDTGTVKLIDVGLVALLQRLRPGDLLGTATYIPPERVLGMVLPPEHAHRSDVYSFAVLCFEMLTGRRPFLGRDEDKLFDAHARQAPPRASEVSSVARAFDAPLLRALAKSPLARPNSCGDLVRELELCARGADASGSAIRILIVDDDDDYRAFVRAYLRMHLPTAVVTSASDASAALEIVQRERVDVAVVDLVMPGGSGIDLVSTLRATSPATTIVVATGSGSGAERSAVSEVGVRSFLVKPYDCAELVATVLRLTAGSHAHGH
jgi:serine/threonine protein kinase